LPGLKIKDAKQKNLWLEETPLPHGFVNMPIYTYLDYSIDDDVSYNGCTYVKSTSSLRHPDNANYSDFWWVANFVREPLSLALSIPSEEMAAADFRAVYHYADAYVSREFEGAGFA